MLQYDAQYPQYGLAQHKGYGVPAHLAALRLHGPSDIHRQVVVYWWGHVSVK